MRRARSWRSSGKPPARGFATLPKVEWAGLQGPVRLLEPLVYTTAAGRVLEVPAGLESDLESRPTFLPGGINWLLGTALSTALAALVHDELYREGPALSPPISRAQADAIYYEILRLTGTGWVGSSLAWAGLRVGGGRAWRVHRLRDA